MNLSAKSRFTTIMVVTASVAMMLVGALAWFEGRASLEKAEYTHLTGIREGKARQIEGYFEQMNKQLSLMSEDRTTVSAMVHLSRGFRNLNQTTVTPETEAALEDYYRTRFMPALGENIVGPLPDLETFLPKTQPGRHIQSRYIVERTASDQSPFDYRDPGDGTDYAGFHAQYHDGFASFLQAYGFYDVFLIDFDTSDIVYSVFKEVDVGTNLATGPYRSSGLADVVRQVQRDPIRGHVKIVDFAPYAPSFNAPASFIAAPIFNGPHAVGILAFQIPVDKIENIMTSDRKWKEEGLGETGETYIIGEDLLMRSNSRFLMEDKDRYFEQLRARGVKEETLQLIEKLNTTILLQRVDTPGARAAIRGETSNFVAEDYRGVDVLTTAAKLDIDGLDWGMVTEIDEVEAFAPIGQLTRRVLISTAIFIPIVAYLSYLLSQSFMTPVERLTNTARTLRKHYDADETEDADKTRFRAHGAAEYRDLSSQLNGVMDKVRDDRLSTRAARDEYTQLITAALPKSVAERLKGGEETIVDRARMATVIFLQIENFDSVSSTTELEEMAATMALQSRFDDSATQRGEARGVDVFHQMGMELIGICGLSLPYPNHSQRVLHFARDMFEMVETFNRDAGADLILNVGIATGPLFGELKRGEVLDYDVIGEAVTLAREFGYIGPSNAVNISERTQEQFASVDIDLPFEKTKHKVHSTHGEKHIMTLTHEGFMALTLPAVGTGL